MIRQSLVFAACLCAASAAWPQSPGLLYTPAQGATPSVPASGPSGTVPPSANDPVSSRAGLAHQLRASEVSSTPSPDAAASSPATSPATPAASVVASPSAASPAAPVSAPATAVVVPPPPAAATPPAAPKAANAPVRFSDPTKAPGAPAQAALPPRPTGARVIRSQVDPELAQAEAAVGAELPLPAYRPSFSPPHSIDQTASLTPHGDGKPMPRWVTSGLDRTSDRTQILVRPGVTEMVRIGRNFPNRFTTPFEAAEVITTDENLTHDGVGGSVIVATASDRPIGIFIADRNSDRAIPIVLIPEDIPQRDVRLVLDDSWGPPQLRLNHEATTSPAALPSAQSEYVDFVKAIMRSLALGEVPDGHALSPLQPEYAPACQMPGLTLKLGQMLEGARSRIAVYRASNETTGAVPVQEAGCYRVGVLAVSSFPRPVLEPGQDTEVFVVFRKELPSERATSKRRPVLVAR